jgi:hypothetical protein
MSAAEEFVFAITGSISEADSRPAAAIAKAVLRIGVP